MALEATHIRFALDVQDVFEVKDINRYISGCIYPDSRYTTGIDRMLTHDDSQMAKAFWEHDDFRKGWATHLLYDKLQFSVHTDWFKDMLKKCNPEMTGEEDWIVRTALKILQDIDDLQRFSIKPYLYVLNHIETPNGEDEEKVRRYTRFLIDIYQKSPNVSIDDLERMWVDWNVPAEIASKVRDKAYAMQEDNQLMLLVSKIYEETLARKDELYNTYCV